MKSKLLILTLLLGLLGALIAPGAAGTVHAAAPHVTTTQTHAQAFDKTRFVAHLAFAFGAFHHWIYKPYKAGQLSRHHLFTVAKAALAALFVVHELKVDYNLAKGSNSKTLQVLISPINGLISGFSALGSKIRGGDTSSVNSLQSQTGSFESLAGKNGYSIKEQTPSSLSGTP